MSTEHKGQEPGKLSVWIWQCRPLSPLVAVLSQHGKMLSQRQTLPVQGTRMAGLIGSVVQRH